ncbi:MAG TPA: O-antigen ligase family protein [Vicinamibacterales bacterium]|nr:O-antigen ligase family protein [Vicinamibacterales bacterium]
MARALLNRLMTGFAGILMATLAWGVLAFGGVYPWAYWPLAAASASLGVWAIVKTHAWHDARVRALARWLGAIAAAVGLQMVALPYAWLDRWSPSVDRFLRDYQIGYLPAVRHPLSIAPASTAVALALFCAFALLLLGLVRGIRLVRLEWLVSALIALGLGLAIFGVIQQALIKRADPLVYGMWRPGYGATPFGPFVNKNHFAGWMVMVLPVVVSYLVALVATSQRPRELDWPGALRWLASIGGGRLVFIGVSLLIMGLAVVLTGSRSGMVSAALAFGVVAVLLWRRPETRIARRFVIAGGVVLVAAAVLWAGLGATLARFEQATGALGDRWGAWQDTVRIIKDFPVFGTGLGTYGYAMLVYQTVDRTSIYAQAHNDYLQLAAEGGLLVGVPAVIAMAGIGRGIWRRLASSDEDVLTRWLRAGAVAGLIGIAAQSLVDFSLQMPGNTVMFVLLLALALHRPHRRLAHAHRI